MLDVLRRGYLEGFNTQTKQPGSVEVIIQHILNTFHLLFLNTCRIEIAERKGTKRQCYGCSTATAVLKDICSQHLQLFFRARVCSPRLACF